jgi:alcohol dehydrogenase class IV
MQPFTFHAPTRIIFGEDTACSIGEIVKELGGKKSFIVTDANLIKAGLLDRIIKGLMEEGLGDPVVFSDVPPDSDVPSVTNAARSAAHGGCDNIIAVGGGSVIDTAKVANICISYGGDMLDYQGLNNLPSRLKPLICVPTTAGTGSEVSLVAMIKDHAESKKLLFGSRYLAPDVAVLDPQLILSLPAKLTAGTGLDALTHCLEALGATSTSSPLSDALALDAAKLIFKHLPVATADGANSEARSATLVASMMAGLSFTNAGVGIVHAMAHATGARYGTHHGMTNAVFLPHGLEFNQGTIAHKYAYAAKYLGITDKGDDNEAAGKLIEAVRDLILQCKLPLHLKDLGVPPFSESELDELAMMALTDPAIMFNPREASTEDIIEIYKRAY